MCFDRSAVLYIIYTCANFGFYAPNNRSLLTIFMANGPVRLLHNGTVGLGVEGIDGKPLNLELKDVLHLPPVVASPKSSPLFLDMLTWM